MKFVLTNEKSNIIAPLLKVNDINVIDINDLSKAFNISFNINERKIIPHLIFSKNKSIIIGCPKEELINITEKLLLVLENLHQPINLILPQHTLFSARNINIINSTLFICLNKFTDSSTLKFLKSSLMDRKDIIKEIIVINENRFLDEIIRDFPIKDNLFFILKKDFDIILITKKGETHIKISKWLRKNNFKFIIINNNINCLTLGKVILSNQDINIEGYKLIKIKHEINFNALGFEIF